MTLFQRAFRYYQHSPRLFRLGQKLGVLPFLESSTRNAVLQMAPFPFERNGDSITFDDGKFKVELPIDYARIVCREWASWPSQYGFDVSGKTVLDAGAGAGETAWFYFRQGASRIVTFEVEQRLLEFQRKNQARNNWDMQVHEEFNLASLSAIPHDFLKMDIEGAEEMLLKESAISLGPCRMELHPSKIGQVKCDAIIEKFGLRRINPRWDIWGRDD